MRDVHRDEGAVAIIVAIVLIVLMAAVALTVDVGGLYLRRRALVNGSDAAALSAARTCARGGADTRFATPEEAADEVVRMNVDITTGEVAGPNITELPTCGTQWGHVSVSYTSAQSLFFAPVLGFEHSSPVTTDATASWGLGSNNPVPIVVSSVLGVGCPVPPSGWPADGERCAFWYDNDRLEGGNFAFLSLNPRGWNVPIDGNCSGSQAGGTSTLTGWINGSIPASVVLNWIDPTYVCSDSGIRGVGGDSGPNSQIWGALHDLIGETRDFPINWEGPGAPTGTAPPQGTVYRNGNIDKYDIIGFAEMTIVDVLNRDEASGGTGTCTTRNGSPYTWNDGQRTLQLDSISVATSGWQGCPIRTPTDTISNVALTNTPSGPACCTLGVHYTYDAVSRTVTWLGAVPTRTKITFDWTLDPNNGPCGPVPSNASAMCVLIDWQGSTLDDDFVPGTDKNTVVRLCDLSFGTCLDQ